MKFEVSVDVMPARGISDPQGQTVERALPTVGIEGVFDVRVGKHITFTVEAADRRGAEEVVGRACEKLLANTVIEDYSFDLTVIEEASG